MWCCTGVATTGNLVFRLSYAGAGEGGILIRKALGSTYPLLLAAGMLALLAGTPREAKAAGALSWFGNDSRSAGMGGTGVASGVGAGTLLLNPALMSFCTGGAWISFSATPNWMGIDLRERPAGFDVPDSIYESHPGGWGLDRPLPTSMLTRQRADTRGNDPSYLLSIVAIDTFFHEDLRLGLGFTTPLPGMVNVQTWYNDEREQFFSNKLHFERFGEFDSAMTFYPGISFAPLDWLSLGFTLQIDLMLDLDSRLFLTESTEWEYSYLNTGGEVRPLFRPVGGLAFRIPFGMNVGVVYRHESYVDVKVDIDLRVWNGERLDEETGDVQMQFKQSHRNVLGYKPKELSLGVSYTHDFFTVEVSPTWEMWSDYLDRHGNDWTHPDPDPGDDTVADGWDSDWKDPEFRDVVSVRGGVEFRVSNNAALRAGVAHYPSPMPLQTGRYNYVDNDLTMYSIGAGFRFPIAERIVTTDLAVQLWHMHTLIVKKTNTVASRSGLIDEVPDTVTDFDGVPLDEGQGLQTNNPGFPGYEVGGLALNVSLMIGIKFD